MLKRWQSTELAKSRQHNDCVTKRPLYSINNVRAVVNARRP